MRDAARDAGVANFVNFEFRHSPGRRKVRDLVAGGAIGALVHIHYAGVAGFLRERGHGWLNQAELGGGWLGAHGSHIVDMARWIGGGKVSACGGVTRIDVAERLDADGARRACTAEDAYAVWLRLDTGLTATLESSSCAAVTLPQRTTFVGSAGAIELVEENVITLHQPGCEPQVLDCTPAPLDGGVWPAIHAWLGEVKAALQSGQRIAPDFDDGLATREVLDALLANCVKA